MSERCPMIALNESIPNIPLEVLYFKIKLDTKLSIHKFDLGWKHLGSFNIQSQDILRSSVCICTLTETKTQHHTSHHPVSITPQIQTIFNGQMTCCLPRASRHNEATTITGRQINSHFFVLGVSLVINHFQV